MSQPLYTSPAQPRKGLGGLAIAGITAGAALVVMLPVALLGGAESQQATPAPPASSQNATSAPDIQVEDPAEETEAAEPSEAPQLSEPAEDVQATEEPSDEPVEEPAEPEMTNGQEQAVGKAQDYLEYTHFSKKSLIKQLKYEGFSNKEATFAVDYIDVNWKKQAAGKAKDYLDYTHFSRSSLIQQLRYEGFTQSEAEYGAKKAGL